MGQMHEAVKTFLKEEGLRFRSFEKSHRCELGMRCSNGNWSMEVQAREESTQVLVLSSLPVNCPSARRAEMCDFLTRINWILVLGNWEMDVDGEIRFRTTLDLNGHDLTSDLMKPIFHANLSMMNRFLPFIMRMIYSDAGSEEMAEEALGFLRKRADAPEAEGPGENAGSTTGTPEPEDSDMAELRRQLEALIGSNTPGGNDGENPDDMPF